MKDYVKAKYDELFERVPALMPYKSDILAAFELMTAAFRNGNKLLVCGNGGSCADSEHITGELMKSFLLKRPVDKEIAEKLSAYEDGEGLASLLEGALPVISLCGHSALSTAFINDKEPLLVFAQQVMGYGNRGDVLLTISTSGNSKNCVYAAQVAKAKGLNVIAMTGENDSKLSAIADVTIKVPATETFIIQEYHISVYHALCAMLEGEFFA